MGSELDSFRTWKAFACSSPNLGDTCFGVRTQIISHRIMSMIDYATSLNSRSLDFITSLVVCDMDCSSADLINISKITKLGSLTISLPSHDKLHDRVFRAWRRAAKEAGAFAYLRVFVHHGRTGITHQLCEFLKALPALRFVSICTPAATDDQIIKGLPAKPVHNMIPEMLVRPDTFEALDLESMLQYLFRTSISYPEQQRPLGDITLESLPFFTLSLGKQMTEQSHRSIRENVRLYTGDMSNKPNKTSLNNRDDKNDLNTPSERPPESEGPSPIPQQRRAPNNRKMRLGKIVQADMSLFRR